MGWRKITVNNKEYRWRGSYHVVIQDSEGKRVSPPTLTAPQVKRITPDEWERGKWKITESGMLRPSDIKDWIESTL